MNFRLLAVVAILCGLLSGCATGGAGPDFAAVSQSVGAPRAGHGRVVVFREKAYAGMFDGGWDVKLDGEALRPLKVGTYVYADRPAGRHQLSADATMFPGVTYVDVTVVAGRTSFFVARQSERAKKLFGAQVVGGLAGLAIGSAVTSDDPNPGPLDFLPLEEGAARAAMSELRLAE